MQQPTLRFNLPAGGDFHQEAPPDATSVSTAAPEEASTSVATTAEEVGDDVATREPFDAWAKGTEFAEQAYALALYWYRLGIADATRHGGLARTVWEGHGTSLAELSRYAGDRGWLPDGHPGGPLKTGVPVAYYRLVAPVAVGGALAWMWVWSRLLRLVITVSVAGLVVLLVMFT